MIGFRMVGAAWPARRRWVWLCVAGLLMALLPLLAQAQPGSTTGVFEFARPGARRVAFDFSTRRNLIIVAVRLNGQGPYHFLLDSGVGTSLLTNTALADSLHLTRIEEVRVIGAGGENKTLRAFRTSGVRVELPGLVAPHMNWVLLSDDALNLSGYAGTRIDGILGSEFFRSVVVAIRPIEGRLVCYPPATYHPPRRRTWESLPLRLDQGKAYLELAVDQLPQAPGPAAELPLLVVLDTGAGHALSLETTADRQLHLPPQHLRTDLGRGLGGLISGYLGRVASARLGRYRVRQVITSFPDSGQVHQRLHGFEARRQGNLGYELLKRFNLIIDYPHQRLLLRPNSQYRMVFEHDMSGLELLATGPGYRRYLVLSVAPGSPAAAAGILPDEELLTINLLPVGSLQLSEISRLLRAQDGQHLHLIMRRPSGELYPVSVRLRRQI